MAIKSLAQTTAWGNEGPRSRLAASFPHSIERSPASTWLALGRLTARTHLM